MRPWEEICWRLINSDAMEGVGTAEVGADPTDARPSTSRGTQPPAAPTGGKKRRKRVTPSPPATPPSPVPTGSPSVLLTAPPTAPPPIQPTTTATLAPPRATQPITTTQLAAPATTHPTPAATPPVAPATQPTPIAMPPAAPTNLPTPSVTQPAPPTTAGGTTAATASHTVDTGSHGLQQTPAAPVTPPPLTRRVPRTPLVRARPPLLPTMGSPTDSQGDMVEQDLVVSPNNYSIPDAPDGDPGEGGDPMQAMLADLMARLGQLEHTCRMPCEHNRAVLAAMERQAVALEQQAAGTARLAASSEVQAVAASRQAAASEAILLALRGQPGGDVVGGVGEVKAAVASVSAQLKAANRARCVAERRMRVHSRAHHAATTGVQTAVAELTTEVRLQGQHTCAALAECTAAVREGHAAATLAAVAIPSSSTSPARSSGNVSAGNTPQQSPHGRGRRGPGRPRSTQ